MIRTKKSDTKLYWMNAGLTKNLCMCTFVTRPTIVSAMCQYKIEDCHMQFHEFVREQAVSQVTVVLHDQVFSPQFGLYAMTLEDWI